MMDENYVQLSDGTWRRRDTMSKSASQGISTENPPIVESAKLTDTANAELLASLFGNQLRHDHRRHRWLLWGRHRWEPDRNGHISRLAVEAARTRYSQAETIADLKERQRVANWAIASESRMRLDACLSIAKSIKPIADSGENWDTEPMLLGVANGVVDLRTGELRKGDPDDRITMTTGIEFDQDAQCPRWQQFLDEVFSDKELEDWLHRALGYSITGDTTEQTIFVCHGIGSNGKTVFVSGMRAALGGYSYTAPFSTFELYQRASIPNDLAALEFRRFVTSSETNDNTRLNEARVKAISGGDPITARFLHAEFTTFLPHLKLWLFVNHKPKVTDDSFGFWRRVRLIPFIRQFLGKNEDKQLAEKLRSEAPGILAWLVHGCLEWQSRGLEPVPKAVETATETYRLDSDDLAGFITETCIEHPKASIKASTLYETYKAWAEEQGMRGQEVMSATAFGRKVGERYQKEKARNCNYYIGIGKRNGDGGGFVEGFEANDAKINVFPIYNTSRVESEKTIHNPPPDIKNPPHQDDDLFNSIEAVLGMPIEKALKLWRSQGAPVIHLGPRENCLDLSRLLSSPNVKAEHLESIKAWLDKQKLRGEA